MFKKRIAKESNSSENEYAQRDLRLYAEMEGPAGSDEFHPNEGSNDFQSPKRTITACPTEDAVKTKEESGCRMTLLASICSDKGPRQTNEDCAMINAASTCFAISDGIGGAPLGEAMSRAACVAAIAALDDHADCREAFQKANEAVIQIKNLLRYPKSGATLLIAEQRGARLDLAWAGDTIAYRLREGLLELMTEVGRAAAGSNALDAAVGCEQGLEPRTASFDIKPGDRFLLCTDGVWETYADDEIAEKLATSFNAPIAADRLVSQAARTGHDNASAIVVFATDEEQMPFVGDALDSAKAGTPTIPRDDNRRGIAESCDVAQAPAETTIEIL